MVGKILKVDKNLTHTDFIIGEDGFKVYKTTGAHKMAMVEDGRDEGKWYWEVEITDGGYYTWGGSNTSKPSGRISLGVTRVDKPLN